jgi:phospholipase C
VLARRLPVRLPRPHESGIDHVVVVTMENRSFDHLLGWLPGADGKQAGLMFADAAGNAHATFALAPDYRGCSYRDPDHTYRGGRIAYAGGACDGFLKNESDVFAIGYYTKRDLPFLGRAAAGFTVCDRYFSAFMGPTFPNRLYLHCGRTDRIGNSATASRLPTIWDRLAARGVQGRYYTDALRFLFLWGPKYASIMRPVSEFTRACRRGTLPAVSYVDPRLGPANARANDDHPPVDIRAGEYFLSQIYAAVTSSPAWPKTLLVITFDEWGGFFDHVAPPQGADADPSHRLRGFRVPCVLVSPFARRGYVDHGLYDHASILKLIEWRFGLAPLAARDRAARNLANALDFTRARVRAPAIAAPAVANVPCS